MMGKEPKAKELVFVGKKTFNPGNSKFTTQLAEKHKDAVEAAGMILGLFQ